MFRGGGGKPATTPPGQIIEELTAAIADLKDELENAKEAKRYALENLRVQLEANESLEKKLSETALEPEEKLRDRIRSLETEVSNSAEVLLKQRAETDSLREINANNMLRMKELLVQRSQEQTDGELRDQIAALEAQLSISNEISAQVDAIEHELEARDARIDILETELERKSTLADRLREELSEREGQVGEIEEMRAELEQERHRSKSVEQELAIGRREVSKIERQVEEQSNLIRSLQESLAAVPDIDKLRQAVEENENQVINLLGQVAGLSAALKARELELETARTQTVSDSQTIKLITEKISASADALSQAIHSAQFWKTKYITDIKTVTSRLSQVAMHKQGEELSPAKGLPLPTVELALL